MASIVDESIKFIQKHYLDIILVSLGLLIALIVITLKGYDLTPEQGNKKTEELIITENMTSMDLKKMEKQTTNSTELKEGHVSLCEKYQGQSHKAEELCSKMSKSKCAYLPCCVLASLNGREKCVSGDRTGPTYHTDERGNMMKLDYYYYQNKRYG